MGAVFVLAVHYALLTGMRLCMTAYTVQLELTDALLLPGLHTATCSMLQSTRPTDVLWKA